MTRSHYTISADAMREACRDKYGPLIQEVPSRVQMSCVRDMIADALGMDGVTLSKLIAKHHAAMEEDHA